ncbi:MAG: exodeoxyribonuclease VII large subunit, partial [Acidimicrobiia bacterium]
MSGTRTYTISETNRAIAGLFARHTPPRGFWVRGEVQRLSVSRGGHCYFELVEREGRAQSPKAVAAAVLWSSTRARVEASLAMFGLALAEDLGVRVLVRVSFYEVTGRVQLEVRDIDPAFTAGAMAEGRDLLRRRIMAAGLFDANRSLPVPLVPLRIALVTSVGSAAYHDFTGELAASGFAFDVECFDSPT